MTAGERLFPVLTGLLPVREICFGCRVLNAIQDPWLCVADIRESPVEHVKRGFIGGYLNSKI